MNKMFSISFRATTDQYAEIDQQMTKHRFVKPVSKQQINNDINAQFVVYKPDSFFLTRMLQKMNIWYNLQADGGR